MLSALQHENESVETKDVFVSTNHTIWQIIDLRNKELTHMYCKDLFQCYSSLNDKINAIGQRKEE